MRYDWSVTNPVVVVVETVAIAVNREPTELEPLHSHVDADALEALYQVFSGSPSVRSVRVSITYAGCEVTVDGSGQVQVTPLADRRNGSS